MEKNLRVFSLSDVCLPQRFRRLSVDIEALRDTRREVRDKWKTILENLGEHSRQDPRSMISLEMYRRAADLTRSLPALHPGFMAEADSLLTVSASASSDRMRNAAAARSLLHTLSSETSLFESREPPPERYLFILVRQEPST